jgi:hypothetical protein
VSAVNRFLSGLLGLCLLLGGLLVAAEVGSALLGKGELIVPTTSWVAALRDTSYNGRGARLGLGSAAALGLILLVVELWPWRPRRVALRGAERQSWWVQRRSLERYLGRSVATGTGALRARARVRSRLGKVKVRLVAEAPPDAREAVGQRAHEQLKRLLGNDRFQVMLRLKYPKRVV